MPSTVVTFFPIPSGQSGGTGLYTVPAGKFARLSGHTSAAAAGAGASSLGQGGGPGSCGSNNVSNHPIDEGDTVNTATATASASSTSANTSIASSSTADILVNGTIICRSVGYARVRSGTGSNINISIGGAVSARYGIAEFDK